MKVITFASTKGGAGKSTIAAITIDSFLRAGESVRVIDFDKQASLKKWASSVEERTPLITVSKIEDLNDAKFADYYNKLVDIFEDETDWVVIDTAGSDDFRQLAALAISDLVLCPSGPVEDELLGVQKTVQYLKAALDQVAPEDDPMDMLRVIYRQPIGFIDAQMSVMREVLFDHFGVVGTIHHASAITSFISKKETTDEAIAALKQAKKDPKSLKKIQDAADKIANSLRETFDANEET